MGLTASRKTAKKFNLCAKKLTNFDLVKVNGSFNLIEGSEQLAVEWPTF